MFEYYPANHLLVGTPAVILGLWAGWVWSAWAKQGREDPVAITVLSALAVTTMLLTGMEAAAAWDVIASLPPEEVAGYFAFCYVLIFFANIMAVGLPLYVSAFLLGRTLRQERDGQRQESPKG